MYTTDSADYIRFVLLPAAKKRAKATQKKYEKAEAAAYAAYVNSGKPRYHSFPTYDEYLDKKIALLEKRKEEQDKEISEWDEWERKNRAGNLSVVWIKNIANPQMPIKIVRMY